MGVIVVDAAFKAKLLAAGGTVIEIRDEAGEFVGWLRPEPQDAAPPQQADDAHLRGPGE